MSLANIRNTYLLHVHAFILAWTELSQVLYKVQLKTLKRDDRFPTKLFYALAVIKCVLSAPKEYLRLNHSNNTNQIQDQTGVQVMTPAGDALDLALEVFSNGCFYTETITRRNAVGLPGGEKE